MNNKVMVLRGDESQKILRTAINKQIVAIMTYLSKGKWHVAKVLMTEFSDERISIESANSRKKRHPINIQANQPVGISFKYEYGKFVFDTTVVALEASCGQGADSGWGGTIVLAAPDRIEVIQRRSYFRVQVPQSLKVKVVLWHRGSRRQVHKQMQSCGVTPESEPFEEEPDYCQGRLIDISAGGAQVIVPYPYPDEQESAQTAERDSNASVTRCFRCGQVDFRKGQFVCMRFTPMPYEMPVMVSAQIRNILPTSDGKGASLGLQLVGLEASPEGREVLARLISIVEHYYRVNQSGARQQDMQPAQNVV